MVPILEVYAEFCCQKSWGSDNNIMVIRVKHLRHNSKMASITSFKVFQLLAMKEHVPT